MRSKFSEILGMPFESYQSFGQEMPNTDPICRTYNNVFGLALNTTMSMMENGTRVITGHYINTPEWDKFVYSENWGGMDFRQSGFSSFSHFINEMGLTYRKGTLNNDIVCFVEPHKEPEELTVVATESQQEDLNKSTEELNESTQEMKYKPTFDLKHDIYNLLSDLAFEYDLKSKKFDESDVKNAFKWFINNFYE